MSTEAASVPAYAQGANTPALLECTIGQALAQTAERFADREALVVPHQGVRWSWSELLHRTDALAAGLLALGLQGAQLRRVDADAVRHRARRPDPGQHQPGLPRQ